MNDTPERIHWEQVASFAAQYEADLARQILENEDIPVYVRGPEVGIFGPGFSGPSPLGTAVFVPSDRTEEARDLLADLIRGFGGEDEATDEGRS